MDAEQQRRALELCDMAFRVMREGFPGLAAAFTPIEIGDFRFEQSRLTPEGTAERRGYLPNALEVSWRNRKVLTVMFSRQSEPRVLRYEPSEWERELEFLLTPGHGRAQ